METIKTTFNRLVEKIGFYPTVLLVVALCILLSLGVLTWDQIVEIVRGMIA